jgi:type IV secretory pathway protease TraF
MNETSNKRLLIRLAIALSITLGLSLLFGFAYIRGYRLSINVSESFPNRVYLSKMIDASRLSVNEGANTNEQSQATELEPISKGSLILFRHSLPNTPYEQRLNNIDLLKSVACVEGDYLKRIDSAADNIDDRIKETDNGRFLCNGEPIAVVLPLDSKGEPYAISFDYDGLIPQDKLFVTAPHLYSFDSRHFGFIDRSQITGVVKCVIY